MSEKNCVHSLGGGRCGAYACYSSEKCDARDMNGNPNYIIHSTCKWDKNTINAMVERLKKLQVECLKYTGIRINAVEMDDIDAIARKMKGGK